MIQTIEAVVDVDGTIHLLGNLYIVGPRRAIVTVLEESAIVPCEPALLSEASLGQDWNRLEEDEAWKHWQSEM